MQLWCIVRRGYKSLKIKLQQGGSLLLVALFLFISAAQILHNHLDKHNDLHESCGDHDQLQLLDKCAVCDYYHHIQDKQIFLHYLPVLVVALPKAITVNTYVFVGNYKFSLQGYTNKGPPYTV